MKVLHVVYNSWPDVTGAAVRTRYLLRAQARMGLEPVVVSAPVQAPADASARHGVEWVDGVAHYRCWDGSEPGRFMAADKTWRERFGRLAGWPGFVRRIVRAARRERAELIHAHNVFYCGLAAAVAGKLLGLPVVYEVRSLVEEGMPGLPRPARWCCRRLEGFACLLADQVVALCAGLKQELIRRGVPPAKITVAGNGVDPEEHRPGGEGSAVGFVGTLVWYEGVDLLLEAAAKIPELRVLVVGDGPSRAALEQKARRCGLGERVRFAGRVRHETVGQYYDRISVVALPRLSTRLTDAVTPLKPLEAMARGKALVASDCGGHREIVVHGVNGVLFPAGDAEALAEQLRRLLHDEGERARLGRQAREWVSRRRTWEQQQKPVADLYRRLLAERRPQVALVAPAPGGLITGGVEKGVEMILRSDLAKRYRIHVWDRRRRRMAPFAFWMARRRPPVLHVKSSAGINFWESAAYAAIGRALGCKVLLQLHSGRFAHWYGERGRLGRRAVRSGLRAASEILVLSDYWRQVVKEIIGDGRPIRVMPNAVEIPENVFAPRTGRDLTVLTIAALSRHKGCFEILKAASRLRHRRVRFLLAGPDSPDGSGAGDALRRRAAELKLNGSVEFLGPVDAETKRKLLAEADVFLLPSYGEGMPNAVLEAMAAALPVVATAVGSLPEMLPEGVLIPAGDADAIVQALVELERNPGRRRELGRKNRERAAARYSWPEVERRLAELYAQGLTG